MLLPANRENPNRVLQPARHRVQRAGVQVCGASCPREAGFTLVELLVALGLIFILVPALVSLEISNLAASHRAEKLTVVTTYMTSKVEELQSLPYAQVESGRAEEFLPDGSRMVYTWTVEYNTPVASCKTVVLESVRTTETLPHGMLDPLEITFILREDAEG